jgi:hypothetical protein
MMGSKPRKKVDTDWSMPIPPNLPLQRLFHFLLQIAHTIEQQINKGSLLRKGVPQRLGSGKNLALRSLEAFRTRPLTRALVTEFAHCRFQLRFCPDTSWTTAALHPVSTPFASIRSSGSSGPTPQARCLGMTQAGHRKTPYGPVKHDSPKKTPSFVTAGCACRSLDFLIGLWKTN